MAKMKYADLRDKVIETCLAMNEMGINQGTSGNVSARTDEGFLMTASGVPYHKMKREHVVEMDLDGGYRGDYLPSTEWRMHHDIFKTRPEAGAIVHTHSIYATALACLRKDIPAFHYMIGVTGGATLRVSAYEEFGTQASVRHHAQGARRPHGLPPRQSRPDFLRPRSRQGVVARRRGRNALPSILGGLTRRQAGDPQRRADEDRAGPLQVLRQADGRTRKGRSPWPSSRRPAAMRRRRRSPARKAKK